MMRFAFGLLFLVTTLASCTRRDPAAMNVIVLDSDRGLAATIHSATVEGLVGFDEQGRIVPGLADRWTVTDDGKSYIFRLRDGTWQDGAPLTGETAGASLRQALADIRRTPLARELAAIDEVRAMAGRVIEIRLSRPMPEFLQLLAQPELGLARRGRGTGPMTLRREAKSVELMPIAPDRRGLPAVKDWAKQVRELKLFGATAKSAIDRFEEDGDVVVLGGTFRHWPAVADARLPRGAVRLDPVVGLFGFILAHIDGFMADASNREAMAMAIDRDALARALQAPGWIGTTRIVSPGTEGDAGLVAERWAGLDLAQRQAIAGDRLARWRQRHGEVSLRIALPAGLGSDVLFTRLAADLAAVGFKPVRVSEKDAADLRLIDNVARYSGPDWFFAQLNCAVRPKACSPAADASYAAAATLSDPAARSRKIAEAESALAAANVYIPLGTPLRWSLAAADTPGFSPNRWAIHPLFPLALRGGDVAR